MTSADTETWQMRKFPGFSWTKMIEARRTCPFTGVRELVSAGGGQRG
jgi:hypothetical protein